MVSFKIPDVVPFTFINQRSSDGQALADGLQPDGNKTNDFFFRDKLKKFFFDYSNSCVKNMT